MKLAKKSAAKKIKKTNSPKNKKPSSKAAMKSSKKPAVLAAKKKSATPPKAKSTDAKSAARLSKQKESKQSAPKLKWAQMFSPLDDRILVVREGPSERTAGGLFIPENVGTDSRPQSGIVVAAGRGHRDVKGRLRPLDVGVNDRVFFSAHAGTEVEMQNQKITILREQDVLCVAKV